MPRFCRILFRANLLVCAGALIAGCAGTTVDAAATAPTASAIGLAAALADVNRAPIPNSVDPAVIALLKSELKRVLAERGPAKFAAAPPSTGYNDVFDLALHPQSGGDPPYLQWSYSSLGDYDQNGEVNASDLTPLGLNYGKVGPFAYGSIESVVDGDLNGEINIGDVTPIGVHFLTTVTEWNVYMSLDLLDYPPDPDAPNGSGTQLIDTIPQSAAAGLPTERRHFTLSPIQAGAVNAFWVRPSDGVTDGAVSNHVTLSDMNWRHSWGAQANEVAYAMVTDYNAQCHVAGSTDVAGIPDTDIFLLRYGELGQLDYSMLIGGSGTDTAAALARHAGGLYLAGGTSSAGPGPINVLLLSLDFDGNIGWGGQGVVWGQPGAYSWATAVTTDPAGNIWVAGACDTGVASGPLVLKFDSSGALLDEALLDLNGGGQFTSICYNPVDQRVYLAGYFDTDPGNQCVLVAALDSDFNLLLAKQWDGPYEDKASGIGVDSSGAVHVTGHTDADSLLVNSKIFVMKVDATGDLLGGTTIYLDDHYYAAGLFVDRLDRVLVCAAGYPTGGLADEIVLLRLSASGNLLLERYYPAIAAVSTRPSVVQMDDFGYVYLAGCAANAAESWKMPLFSGMEHGAFGMVSQSLQVAAGALNSSLASVTFTPVAAVWEEDSGGGQTDAFVSRIVID